MVRILGRDCRGRGDVHRAIVGDKRDLGGPEATFAENSGIPKERGIGVFGM